MSMWSKGRHEAYLRMWNLQWRKIWIIIWKDYNGSINEQIVVFKQFEQNLENRQLRTKIAFLTWYGVCIDIVNLYGPGITLVTWYGVGTTFVTWYGLYHPCNLIWCRYLHCNHHCTIKTVVPSKTKFMPTFIFTYNTHNPQLTEMWQKYSPLSVIQTAKDL